MSELRNMTPMQIGNRIASTGLSELANHVQLQLQQVAVLRELVAVLNAEVKLLKDQLPEEAKAEARRQLKEAWDRAHAHRGGGRAPAISDG